MTGNKIQLLRAAATDEVNEFIFFFLISAGHNMN